MPTLLPRLALVLTLLATSLLRGEPVPLFEGLGDYHRPVTTKSPDAQKYFDQGMKFLFGFNHGASIRSFTEAARLDPECAMAHWGIALASGPHINFPLVPPESAKRAWAALQLARRHAAAGTAVERDLIEALSARYADPQPEDRSPLDLAYADAMRRVWAKHPADADVGVLFAEAMMDLRPWDQWTPAGVAQPGTEEIIATLDAVVKLRPGHPFANHLYIHAVEASPNPERAIPAADRLRDAQPGLAHNVHMPSHIDIRTGQWQKAIVANTKAIEAQRRYRAIVGPPQDLIALYDAHNGHMLAYAALMTGQSELALRCMRETVAQIPEAFMREWAAVAEGYAAMPLEVLVRFGRWDEILAEPDFPDHMPFSRAFRLAARGIAHAAKGNPAAARAEQAAYLEAARLVPAGNTMGNNPCTAILAVVTPMLEGEILYREGRIEDALAQLRAAVAAEDALRYDEPPGWIVPVRHALGATLMQERRFAEAEQVYRDDLARLPENGWSLFGLAEALGLQGRVHDAAALRKRFESIWSRADVALHSSCFCQPGVKLPGLAWKS